MRQVIFALLFSHLLHRASPQPNLPNSVDDFDITSTTVFNRSMPMPNITFCMPKTLAWSHFRINESEPTDEWDAIVENELLKMPTRRTFLNAKWNFRLTTEAYSIISMMFSMEQETSNMGAAKSIDRVKTKDALAGKRKLIQKWTKIIADRRVSFDDLTQKTGKETLRWSLRRFTRVAFHEQEEIATKLRISWLSEMELCFQPYFDANTNRNIDHSGTFFLMILTRNDTNLKNTRVPCISVDFHGRLSSLNRFIEGSALSKNGFYNELCPGLLTDVKVEIKAQYRLDDDNATFCTNDDSESYYECYARCRLEMIKEMCNCSALSIQVDTEVENGTDDNGPEPECDYTRCDVHEWLSNHVTDETAVPCASLCRLNCIQTLYTVAGKSQGRMFDPELTFVRLKWGSFYYQQVEVEQKDRTH